MRFSAHCCSLQQHITCDVLLARPAFDVEPDKVAPSLNFTAEVVFSQTTLQTGIIPRGTRPFGFFDSVRRTASPPAQPTAQIASEQIQAFSL